MQRTFIFFIALYAFSLQAEMDESLLEEPQDEEIFESTLDSLSEEDEDEPIDDDLDPMDPAEAGLDSDPDPELDSPDDEMAAPDWIPAYSTESNAHYRAQNNWQLQGQVIGSGSGLAPEMGLGGSYQVLDQAFLGFGYFVGRYKGNLLGSELDLAVHDIETYLVYYIGDTFFIKPNISWMHGDLEIPVELIDQDVDAEASLSFSNTTIGIGIGQTWNWNTLFVGCEWIGLVLPVVTDVETTIPPSASFNDRQELQKIEDQTTHWRVMIPRFFIGLSF